MLTEMDLKRLAFSSKCSCLLGPIDRDHLKFSFGDAFSVSNCPHRALYLTKNIDSYGQKTLLSKNKPKLTADELKYLLPEKKNARSKLFRESARLF